jgi:hypothetical protein
VLPLPGHLVHSDLDQPVQLVGVQPVGGDAFADAAHGVPVDAHQPGDRGLVGLGGQVGHQVLEVAGEPGPVPGERHPLNPNPVFRAVDPAQLGAHLHSPPTQIQVPPPGGHPAGVATGRGGVVAQRADQPLAAQRHGQLNRVGREGHTPHADAGQRQQAIEYGGDAHGSVVSLSFEGSWSISERGDPSRARLSLTTVCRDNVVRKGKRGLSALNQPHSCREGQFFNRRRHAYVNGWLFVLAMLTPSAVSASRTTYGPGSFGIGTQMLKPAVSWLEVASSR